MSPWRLCAVFLAMLAGTAQAETLFIEGTQFTSMRVKGARQEIERMSFAAAISQNGEWQVRTHYPATGVEQTVGSLEQGLYSYTSSGMGAGAAVVFRSEEDLLISSVEFTRVIWAAFVGSAWDEGSAKPLPLWAPRPELLRYKWTARTNTAPPYLAERIDFVLDRGDGEEKGDARTKRYGFTHPIRYFAKAANFGAGGEGYRHEKYVASQTWDPVYQTVRWTNVGGWTIPLEGRFDHITSDLRSVPRRHTFVVTNAWLGSETGLKASFAPNSSITYLRPTRSIHTITETGRLLSLQEARENGSLLPAARWRKPVNSNPELFQMALPFLLLWVLLPALGAWRVRRNSVKEMNQAGGFRNLPLLLLGDAGRKMNR